MNVLSPATNVFWVRSLYLTAGDIIPGQAQAYTSNGVPVGFNSAPISFKQDQSSWLNESN
jgi:hypothetical protein